jgi:hypothetical protein
MVLGVTLIAISLLSTVSATGNTYYCNLVSSKKGQYVTITIDTSSAKTADITPLEITHFGNDINPSTIVITFTDDVGNPIATINSPFDSYTASGDAITIVIDKSPLPHKVTGEVYVAGTLISSGDTVIASGPGWTWGRR